jgi:hypothetical protein
MREKEREVPVLGRDRLGGLIHRHVGYRVDVHVPQPRDEIAALRLHNVRVGGYRDLRDGPHDRDPVALDKDGPIRAE